MSELNKREPRLEIDRRLDFVIELLGKIEEDITHFGEEEWEKLLFLKCEIKDLIDKSAEYVDFSYDDEGEEGEEKLIRVDLTKSKFDLEAEDDEKKINNKIKELKNKEEPSWGLAASALVVAGAAAALSAQKKEVVNEQKCA